MRIDDMLEAARRIESYVAGLTADQFAADPKTFDAVVRNLRDLKPANLFVTKRGHAKRRGVPGAW